jgi:hypothetical protein
MPSASFAKRMFASAMAVSFGAQPMVFEPSAIAPCRVVSKLVTLPSSVCPAHATINTATPAVAASL